MDDDDVEMIINSFSFFRVFRETPMAMSLAFPAVVTRCFFLLIWVGLVKPLAVPINCQLLPLHASQPLKSRWWCPQIATVMAQLCK